MSFNDEALKDGRGRALLVDVSLDSFATIYARWGDVSGLDEGGTGRQARVRSLAPIRRGLGQQRIAAGGTTELVLDNADGELDWLCGRESISTQAKLRLRVYVALYDPTVSPVASYQAKLLGEYTLTEWTRQDNTSVTLPLGDDVMGVVSQQAALPTPGDWHAVGTAATNPLFDGYALSDAVTGTSPVQLAFGEDWVLAMPHILPFGSVHANYQNKIIVPVCCTTDTGAGAAYEISELRIHWQNSATGDVYLRDVPRTVRYSFSAPEHTVWTTERSPTITKNGKSFKIIYLVVRADLGALNSQFSYLTGGSAATAGVYDLAYGVSPQFGREWAGGYAPTAIFQMRGYVNNDPMQQQYANLGAGVIAWWVKGVPLSARTQTTSAVQHPVDVLTDLVTYYSDAAVTVDATQAARCKGATRLSACAGAVQPWQQGPRRGDPTFQPPPSLRQTITAICQSSDIDVFIDWNGQFSFATDFWDFRVMSSSSGWATLSPSGAAQASGDGTTTTYTPVVIPEAWLESIERWVPGGGERWSAYNRLWFSGGRSSPADGVDAVPYQGPFDFDGTGSSVALSDRIIEASLEQGWRPFRQMARSPWFWRQLNTVARDIVRFRTHIGALQLEIGQYFALTWTRGVDLAGPYSATIFQCEGITYAAEDDSVEVTAVWRQDVVTERQYLLDNETLLTRAKVGSGNALPSGLTNVEFAATVTLASMGVAVGDILVLKDSTQADDVFTRYGAWRITDVDVGVPEVQVAPNAAGAYPAAGTVANADWSIQRGATTRLSGTSLDYPLGSAMYGAATDATGDYSNAEEGHRLTSG